MMSDKLEVPRLKAKKDWYVGLNPEPVDHSHPDVHDDQLIQEAALHSIPRMSFVLLRFYTIIMENCLDLVIGKFFLSTLRQYILFKIVDS